MIDFTRLAFEAARRGGLQPSVELLSNTWDILVGEDASRHTRPVAIEHGTITVAVREDWLIEWAHHQDTLLIDIGRFIPDIRTLNFVIGDFEPGPISKENPTALSAPNEDLDADQRLEETLSRIAKLRSHKGDA